MASASLNIRPNCSLDDLLLFPLYAKSLGFRIENGHHFLVMAQNLQHCFQQPLSVPWQRSIFPIAL